MIREKWKAQFFFITKLEESVVSKKEFEPNTWWNSVHSEK